MQFLQSLFNRHQPNQMRFPPSPNMISRGGPFYRPFPPFGQMPFYGNPYSPMVPQPQGGFLAKLFGQAGQQSINFPTIINNIQSVLKTAETTIPMIQQYGPMIKNIPAMIQLLKEFNDLDDNPDDSEATEGETTSNSEEKEELFDDFKATEQGKNSKAYENEEKNIKKVEYVEKKSKAKLYI